MENVRESRSSVSIVTITQLDRFECLRILYDLIQLQTYQHIIEWVIVEGSQNEEKGKINEENIQKLMENHSLSFKIVYIHYSNHELSDLRNLGNNICQGDIIVCMDDDDYYPQERVEHAVENLEKSPYLIAGCTDVYLYEYRMKKMYKLYGFHSNHSTNNVMAFKRSYLLNHRHDSGLCMAEEKSFTNGFREPMVQLQANKSIVVSSHACNTFDKQDFCIHGIQGRYPTLYEVDKKKPSLIPTKLFDRMSNNFQCMRKMIIYNIVSMNQ